MSLGDLLRTKSSEYELIAEWHAERAPLDDEHFRTHTGHSSGSKVA
jgi:hypothetical protein